MVSGPQAGMVAHFHRARPDRPRHLAAIARYAYDQIDQARTELNAISERMRCEAGRRALRQTSAHKMPTIPLQLQISPLISGNELSLLGGVFALPRWPVGSVQS